MGHLEGGDWPSELLLPWDGSAAPGGHQAMSCQSQKWYFDNVYCTHSRKSLYLCTTLWHFVFCAEVYFGRKINALLVFFPVRIVVSGLGHFFASLRAARVSGSIFKLLCCCLEYKLFLPEEVQHHLKNIGFYRDVQCWHQKVPRLGLMCFSLKLLGGQTVPDWVPEAQSREQKNCIKFTRHRNTFCIWLCTEYSLWNIFPHIKITVVFLFFFSKRNDF